MRAILSLVFLLAFAAAAEAAQPPAQSGPPRTYHVAGPIHVAVQEDRNSMVVVGPDSLLLFETNYVERAQNLKNLVATISPLPVRYAINSHWHADHIGGNALFRQGGAITISHENTRKRMSVEQRNPATGNVQAPAWAPEFLPMITITDQLTIPFAGEEVTLIHTPDAHTDADLFAHFPRSNVIFTGGLLNYPTYAGIRSADRFVAALDRLLSLANAETKIVPWRGPLIGRVEVQEWRDLLATVSDRVATMVRENKSIDEIIASRPSREFDPKWSPNGNSAGFIRQIHAGMTQPLN
jgi:glyoxylase-like metal-dependent hydrolase (beta-lactamase superfamily II)